MKTIGLIGGMSWESTVAYYRLIHGATCGEWSRNFAMPDFLMGEK